VETEAVSDSLNKGSDLSPSIEIKLRDFVADFRNDAFARKQPFLFGIRLRDAGEWNVRIDSKGEVVLGAGLPPEPSVCYATNCATIEKIHSGEISALTCMAKARGSDPAPMEIEFMEGCKPDKGFFEFFIPFTFHFWTRGIPKIVPFGSKENTREVHGADAAVFYYQKGLRTGWYRINPGQHINKNEEDQANLFPTLTIFTRGEAQARIGGRDISLRAGQTVLIPEQVTHEFWNDNKEPAEFIIIMFGDGA
jgi:mannose-6-phosphate isomerase-like protein (cupin superfamily)